ncbi:unnamed protein product [Symbiodinium natans]|uniref:Uncharacterized protein n=1 Tax=Symbiodinium natans TaxID=878477 RepID=A0A812NUT1_9DINO|nr:unnamed protein product [Symbiodinium natans]
MLAIHLVALLGLVGPCLCATRSALRRNEAMPDPSAVAAPFFPFVGRVAVLTPKERLTEAISNMSITDVLGNLSASDEPGSGDDNSTNAAAPSSTAEPEVKVEGAASPLVGNASADVQAQVSEAMQQAQAKGTAEVEDAVEDAKEKWVDEAKIVQLEDSAKMDEAVSADLADVRKKVEAVRSVQIHALQSMADDVKAAMANITETALDAAVDTTRTSGQQYQHQVLSSALQTIQHEEGSIEHLQGSAVQHLQAAQEHATRLRAATAVAQGVVQNYTTSPEDIAAGLRKHVAESMAKARGAKASAEATLELARKASEAAGVVFSEANASEAAAQGLLDRALAQAKHLDELEQRTATAAKQAAVTELLRKAGLMGAAG